MPFPKNSSYRHTNPEKRMVSQFGIQNGRILFASLLIFLLSYRLHAQNGLNYAVHANIVYHFTKYINWPENGQSEDFVIGVNGDSPIYDELKRSVTNKTIGSRKIVVRKVTLTSRLSECQILFISDDTSNNLKKMVAATAGLPILIVSESEGMATKGSCINFVIVEDHLKLEINKSMIEKRGLSIASELLGLGKIVN